MDSRISEGCVPLLVSGTPNQESEIQVAADCADIVVYEDELLQEAQTADENHPVKRFQLAPRNVAKMPEAVEMPEATREVDVVLEVAESSMTKAGDSQKRIRLVRTRACRVRSIQRFNRKHVETRGQIEVLTVE